MRVRSAEQRIGNQHRIVERRDLDLVARQQRDVPLDVQPNFENARILKQRFQRADGADEWDLRTRVGRCFRVRLFTREQLSRSRIGAAMRERHIDRVIGAER